MSAHPLVDVTGGTGHRSGDEVAGARGLPLLVPVDEHMHRDSRLDHWERITHAQARRLAAAWAAGGPGEYDASSHAAFARGLQYPRQGPNKSSLSRRKPQQDKVPGAKSGTTKRGGRRGPAKKAKGRKGGAR